MSNAINVYSEIGKLNKVLVHCPGQEIDYIVPTRLDELLFSAILQPEQARKEHKEFTKILNDQGVETVELTDLVVDTYNQATPEQREAFIKTWLSEVVGAATAEDMPKIEAFIRDLSKEPKKMVEKMMAGITCYELGLKPRSPEKEMLVDPMPNLYFTRDPFATVGNGVTIHHMKHIVRRRETVFADFIFTCNPEYKDTPRFYNRNDVVDGAPTSVEGGDIFVYSDKILAIGLSERTDESAIRLIAKNIQNDKACTFEKIVVINVPKMGNLMHLDTWLTMLDHDKFLYSPNIQGVLKIWEIDLKDPELKWVEHTNKGLSEFLSNLIGKPATLIPIAGEGASQMDIDIETHFDGTNYIAIAPGVVVGYNRNSKTEAALIKAGIKVLSWNGNQLSLGMGSARCMTMPLIRENLK